MPTDVAAWQNGAKSLGAGIFRAMALSYRCVRNICEHYSGMAKQ